MRPSAGPNSRTFEGALPLDAQTYPANAKHISAPSPNRPRSHTSVRLRPAMVARPADGAAGRQRPMWG
eukprot:4885062-Pyramimonas_sp.AAC.1